MRTSFMFCSALAFLSHVKGSILWGISLILCGLFSAAFAVILLSEKKVAVGIVTDLPISSSGSRGAGHLHVIVAKFKDELGIEKIYRSNFAISEPGYRVGDKIPLCYAEKEGAIEIASFSYQFGTSFILAYIGFFILMSSVIIKIGESCFAQFVAPNKGLKS